MRALHAALLGLVGLAACSDPTELMLIVKAGPGLTYGPTADKDISQLIVRVQLAGDPKDLWFHERTIELCPTDDSPMATCRPQKYADKDYEGSLTLPVRLLFAPGSVGVKQESRVEVAALAADGTTKVLDGAVRFRFSDGHRLWLEVPLFKQCLGKTTCFETDQLCGSDRNCTTASASMTKPPDADSSTLGDMASSVDSGSSVDASMPVGDMATFPSADLSSPVDMSVMSSDLSISHADMFSTVDLSAAPSDFAAVTPDLAACAVGMACCASNVCSGGTAMQPVECIGGTCTECGTSGQPCCASGCVGGGTCGTTAMSDGGMGNAITTCQ